MPPIQIVTLDLWQTLIIDNEQWGRERSRLRIEGAMEALRDAGESFTGEHVRKAYRACYESCAAIRHEGRDVTFKEQVQTFVRGIGDGLLERISREAFARVLNRYADAFFESPPAMAEGVAETLTALKDQDYRLGIISNTGATPGRLLRAYLEDLDILRFFDHLTFSDEITLAKPSPAIFLHTLASMGSPPDQAVHVGDHLRNDIAGAQAVGMRTVWLQGFDSSQVKATPTTAIQRITELPETLARLKAS